MQTVLATENHRSGNGVFRYSALMSMKYDRFTVEFVEITPALAKYWLAKNFKENRGKKWSFVEMLKKEIAEDRWWFNGDTICFDDRGRLVDGQNRLQGISEGTKSVMSLVVHNLLQPSIYTIDDGTVRSMPDRSKIVGETNCSARSAVRRTIGLVTGQIGDHERLSLPVCQDLARPFDKSIDWILSNQPTTPRRFRVASVLAALAVAHHKFPDETTLFKEDVQKGANLCAGSPELMFYRYMVEEDPRYAAAQSTVTTRKTLFKETLWAIRLYIEGGKPSKRRPYFSSDSSILKYFI